MPSNRDDNDVKSSPTRRRRWKVTAALAVVLAIPILSVVLLVAYAAHQTDSADDLVLAAYFGHRARVEQLLDAGADVNMRRYGNDTALHAAAAGGQVAIVQLLLDRGAEVNAVNDDQATPLDLVTLWGMTPYVQVRDLLKARGGRENHGPMVEKQYERWRGGMERLFRGK